MIIGIAKIYHDVGKMHQRRGSCAEYADERQLRANAINADYYSGTAASYRNLLGVTPLSRRKPLKMHSIC